MIETAGVLHFTIPVKNLDRAEKFYTDLLGFVYNATTGTWLLAAFLNGFS